MKRVTITRRGTGRDVARYSLTVRPRVVAYAPDGSIDYVAVSLDADELRTLQRAITAEIARIPVEKRPA